MRGISFKAIVVAYIAMMVLDIVLGMVLSLIFGWEELSRAMTEEQMDAAFVVLAKKPAYLASAMLLGTLTTLAGGYIAADRAKILPYMNAFVFGLLGIATGLLMSEGLPLWYNVLGIAGTLPAALLGGHIAKKRTRVNG
ncbi:MAG TPA: hypothetical protein VFX02_04850 [Gammaproteobacteria bacterium]|nr:hypothetical protein [Gammaproteobacteria bacterium]